MSSDTEESEKELSISEEFVQLPKYKDAGTSSLDFDGLLKTPLRLHEDLSRGCGGQLWPAGIVLTKYLLREEQLAKLRDKTMFVRLFTT